MAIFDIPLSPIPHQLLAVVIGTHSYEIEVRQMGANLYTSVAIDGEQVTRMVRATSRGELFPWARVDVPLQIYWQDLQGDEDPQYTGLGSRWVLSYEMSA